VAESFVVVVSHEDDVAGPTRRHRGTTSLAAPAHGGDRAAYDRSCQRSWR